MVTGVFWLIVFLLYTTQLELYRLIQPVNRNSIMPVRKACFELVQMRQIGYV